MNAIATEKAISLNIAKSVLGTDEVQTIDARELHRTIQSKRQFSDWIKQRIDSYGFEEGKDFHKIVKPRNNATEYILTLDTAKEIAMVENNEQGRKIRRYLIDIEKKYREESQKGKMTIKELLENSDPLKLISYTLKKIQREFGENKNLIEDSKGMLQHMDGIIVKQKEEITELHKRLGDQKLLQTNIASLATSEILMTVEEAGEKLNIARNTLYLKMRAKKMLRKDNSPYKNYEGRYFIQRETFYKTGDKVCKHMQTYILPLGFDFLKANFGH